MSAEVLNRLLTDEHPELAIMATWAIAHRHGPRNFGVGRVEDHDVRSPPAPGRLPFALSPRWTAVALAPVPGYLAIGLFLDGEPVEVIDDQEDARAYLRALLRRSRSQR